jgi:hypothetical protein
LEGIGTQARAAAQAPSRFVEKETQRTGLAGIRPSPSAAGLHWPINSAMKKNHTALILPDIDKIILSVRDQKVILDTDLAGIYGVPTFRFNEAVR